jgi:hypothetical protein
MLKKDRRSRCGCSIEAIDKFLDLFSQRLRGKRLSAETCMFDVIARFSHLTSRGGLAPLPARLGHITSLRIGAALTLSTPSELGLGLGVQRNPALAHDSSGLCPPTHP